MDLKPTHLRAEPAREVRAEKITARPTPLRELKDTAATEKRVQERRLDAASLREYRPELKPEEDRVIPLRAIPVTPAQMHQLRERQVTARPLGWTVPGAYFRTE